MNYPDNNMDGTFFNVEQELPIVQGESHEDYLDRYNSKVYKAIQSGKLSEEDYTRQEKSRQLQLEHDSLYDPLTELLNRRGFAEQFDNKVRQYQRDVINAKKTQEQNPEIPPPAPIIPGPLLILDMIDFKKINDTNGHPFGDRVLQDVAKALKHLRPKDIAGRVGGDEFVIFLEGQSLEDGLRAADRIKKLISDMIELEDGFTAGVSIGLAMLPENYYGGNLFESDVYKEADEALMHVKQSTTKNEVGYRGVDGQLAIYEPSINP